MNYGLDRPPPPPDYVEDPDRGTRIYTEAFRTALEYLYTEHIPGEAVEFGTYQGFTATLLAQLMRELERRPRFARTQPRSLWCFDSFKAFPTSPSEIDQQSPEVLHTRSWAPGTGAAAPGSQQRIHRALNAILGADRVRVVAGYYDDTLKHHPLKHRTVALVHIDCDLYASTRQALDYITSQRLISDGAVMLCDDWNCNRARNEYGERRAVQEVFNPLHSPYRTEDFFPYGWHGRAFFIHQQHT